MLSRIADSLFWLNRYTERSDSLLRLVYVHYILSLDRALNTSHEWRSVLEIYSTSSRDIVVAIEKSTPDVLSNLLIDDSNTNSVRAIVKKARENARGAQDHITKEVWEVVNSLYHQINHPSLAAKLQGEQALKNVDSFAKHMALFAGITDNTMSRGLGWNFMNLGKFIERCQQTIVLIRKELQTQIAADISGHDILHWRYLLFALSGYEMHLKNYRSTEYRQNALHQLTLNEDFTRSIIYSLIRIKYYLENIMLIHRDQRNELQHIIGRLNSKVRYMHLATMDNVALERFLQEVETDLAFFSNQLGQFYFSYS